MCSMGSLLLRLVGVEADQVSIAQLTLEPAGHALDCSQEQPPLKEGAVLQRQPKCQVEDLQHELLGDVVGFGVGLPRAEPEAAHLQLRPYSLQDQWSDLRANGSQAIGDQKLT